MISFRAWFRASLAVVFAACATLPGVHAAFTWDGGGGNGNWSTANNWNPNGAPTAGTVTDYIFGGATRTTNSADGTTAWEVNSITFNNTSGAFTISGTTLNLRASGVTNNDTQTQTINNAIALQATATFNTASGGITMGGVISGGFGITKTGTSTLTLNGSSANTFSGTTTINAGTLTLAKTSGNAIAGNITLGDGSGTDTLTLGASNQIADTSVLTFTAGGTPTFNLGTFSEQVGSISSTNTSASIVVGGGTLTTGDASNTTFAGVISGTGSLTKAGSGTFTLSGTNTYTGVTTINAGTLSVGTIGNGGVAGNLGQAANTANRLVLGGGTLQYTGSTASTNRAFTLTAGTTSSIEVTNAATNLTISGAGANTTGSLTKIGAGTLTLSGANAYTGTTTVNAGTLAYGANNVISTGAVTVDGSTAVLSLGSHTDTVGTVTVANGGSITGTGTLTSTGSFQMQDGSVSAILAGTNIGLTKTTAGTVTLSGANTYTGVTTINAGTLSVGTIGNGGVAGNLGKATNAANRLVLGGGTLQYTGSTASTNRAFTLTAGTTSSIEVTNAATNLTISGAAAATTGGLTKIGDGTLTLSGTNAYTGSTTINAGILSVGTIGNGGVAGNLGKATNAAGNLVLGGGTLQYTGSTASTNRAFTLTNGTTSTIDVSNGSTTLTMSGAAAASSGNFVKSGAGTLAVSGAHAYTGTTTVSQGTLQLNANAPSGSAGTLGNAASTVTVNDANTGANNTALLIGTTGVSVARDLSVANLGSGTTTLGGNITSGTGSFTGNIALNRATTLNADGTSNITFSAGVISGSGPITKTGTGTVTLSGTNTYTGSTTINAGILSVGTIGNGGVAGNLGQASNAAGNLVLGGGSLQYTGSTASTNRNFTLNNGTTSTIDVTTAATNLTISGGSTATTGALTKAGLGTLTLSGSSSYSGTTTVSAGTLVANGSSSLGASGGGVTVNSGATLALAGGAAVTQASPTNSVTISKSGTLSLSGTGASGATGALQAVGTTGQTSQWLGNVTLAGNTTISAADNLLILGSGQSYANTLNLNGNTLTLNTTSATGVTPEYLPAPSFLLDETNLLLNLTVSGGAGGLIKNGAGTATLITFNSPTGNTFTGATLINDGKLIVGGNLNAPVLSSTSVTVGDGTGGAGSAILQMGFLASPPAVNNIIGSSNTTSGTATTSMTVNADGFFNMNGGSNALVNLGLTGGHVGDTHLNANPPSSYSSFLAITGQITTNASSQTAVIDNWKLGMSSNSFAVNVADGTAATDLRIDAILANDIGFTNANTAVSMTKTGAGTLALTNSNTYQGVTDIQAGVLSITNSAALGQVSSGSGTSDNGTLVEAAGQLQLDGSGGNLTIGNETLTLAGDGTSTTGNLRNAAGNNVYNGYISLTGNSRINADAGSSLTIASTSGAGATIINGSGGTRTLTIGGAGDVNVNSVIGSNIGTLTKDGAGTLSLAGQYVASATTNVNDGLVKLDLSGSGLTSTAVNLGDGTGAAGSATLQLQRADQLANTAALTFKSDGVLDLNSHNDTVGSLTSAVAGAGKIVYGTGQLTVGSDNSNSSFSGTFTGAAGSKLTKQGTGTLTISSNVNAAPGDFLGNLQLDAGTLALISATNTFANSTLTIAAGATLKLSDATLNIANLTLTGTGTITLDFSGTASTLNVTNTLTIASGITVNIINWQNAADYFYAANWTGAVVDFRGAAPMNQVVFDSPTWVGNDTKWQSYDRQVTPVPEPGTYGAMLVGAMGLLLGWRRFRRAKAAAA